MPTTTGSTATTTTSLDGEAGTILLAQKQEMVRDAIHTFVREAVAPHATVWDCDATSPKDVHHRLSKLGVCGVAMPEELGGIELDYLSPVLILEEIATGDGGTSAVISVSNCPMCSMLMAFANDARKQQWLASLVCDRILGAFYLTEPHVDSGASTLRTTAVQDDDHWILNDVKQFITSGKHADMAIVMAVTGKTAGKHNINASLVPASTPGHIVARFEDRLGQHSSGTTQIVFKSCRIPASCLLGEEGAGYKVALSGLEGRRADIATQSMGTAHAALEAALVYAKEHESFGQPLFAHQTVQFRLAKMATRVDMARQMVWHAASLKDAELPCLRETAMAKLSASEAVERVCSDTIQVFGDYGYVSDFSVEHIYRGVCVCQIYGGTSDTQKVLIAHALAQAVLEKAQHSKGNAP